MSQTHITAVAELKFEALEVGVEKAIIQPDQTDTNRDKSQEKKEVEEQIKKLQEKNQHPKDWGSQARALYQKVSNNNESILFILDFLIMRLNGPLWVCCK